MLPMEDLLLYLNIGFIAFVLIFALIGFMRGTRKSLYYLIVTVIVFGGGWLLKDVITAWMANFNLTFLNLNIQGVDLVTVNQFVPDVLKQSIAGSEALMETDTMFKALVLGLVQMVLRFIFFTVLIMLAFSVFKLIADIGWLFIRPKRKKKMKRPKKSLGSRFGGMGIGAAKGVFYMLLILFPLAGIASIASSISDITTETDLKYNLVFVGDEVIVTPVAESSELDQILEIFDLYNDSLAGKVYSVGNVDTLIFDELFSFKVGDSKIKLRKELETVAKALDKAQVSIGSEAGFDQLVGELLAKDPDTLKEIIDEFAKLELINVVIPVAIEFVLLVEDENGNTMLDSLPEGLNINIEDLRDIDFASDIKNIGYGFVEIATIIDINDFEGKSIDYLALDPAVVKKAIDYIADTDIIRTYAPIGVSYLVSNQNIGQAFTDLGIDIDDLGLEDIEEWDEEIKKFGTIYEAVVNLNIKILEDGGIDFSGVNETGIVNLSNALFESSIIANAIPVVANTLTSSMLPEEMKDVLVFDGIDWDKDEFSALMNATVTIMNADLLNINFDGTFSLEEKTINDLARHLSSSQLLMNNMDNLMDYILSPLDLGEEISIGTYAHWKTQALAERELKAVLGSINILASKGLSDVNSFLSLTDVELNTLLQSNLISDTLVNVLKGYSGPGKQLEFLLGVNNEDISWNDSPEVEVVFTINGNIITIQTIDTANKYHIFSDGKYIGATRTNTFDLTGIENVNKEKISVTGYKEGELRKIFVAIGSLADDLLGEGGFSTDTITNLSDEEIDNILISDILVLSIIDQLEQMAAKEDAFIAIPGGKLTSQDENIKLAAWKSTTVNTVIVEGELSKLLKGIRLFFSGNDVNNFSTDMITNLEDSDIYEMLKSEVITESIIMQIDDFSSDDNLPIIIPNKLNIHDPSSRVHWENKYVMDANNNHVYDNDGNIEVEKDGEITKLLRSLKYIFNGESVTDFDISSLYGENQNEILKSDVLSETIVNMIIDESEKEGSMLHLPPSDYLQDIKATDSREDWYNEYNTDGQLVRKHEIGYLLDAANIITNGADFKNIQFNIKVAYDPDNQLILLQSKVISETIVRAIKDEADKVGSMLHIPSTKYLDDLSTNERDRWYNEYVDGVLTEKGEIGYLLDAADIITNGEDFTNIDFNINIAYDPANQTTLLQSKIISETIVHAIKDEADKETSMLHLPSTNYLDDVSSFERDRWYNKYVDGVLTEKGEIGYLLDAAKIITNGEDFSNINFDINIAYDPVNQLTLLQSKIISETIVHAIKDEADKVDSMLHIPSTKYLDDINGIERDRWYNKYVDGVLTAKGEIGYLLDAANIITKGEDFANINFDIKVAYDPINQAILLQSKVISETIVHAVKDEAAKESSMLHIPSTEYVDDLGGNERDRWYNVYLDGVLTEKGEIGYLLDAADIITKGEDFANINFDIKEAYDQGNQKILLKSKVISETIIHAIKDESDKLESMLYLPKLPYLNDISSDSRNYWYNSYDGEGELLEKGEIGNLLDAANIITDGGSFAGINFDISIAYEAANQEVLLKSKVVSETIVQAIKDETEKTGAMLHIPSSFYVNDVYDENDLNDINNNYRDKWYNAYLNGALSKKGEIAYLLDAAKIITNGGSFAGINFDISIAYEAANQEILLKSKVVSETIVQAIKDETEKAGAMLHLPSSVYLNDLFDVTEDKRDKWYNIYLDEVLSKKGEIAYLLDAANVITGGKDFAGINFDISVAYNPVNQDILLKSKVVSETIVQAIKDEVDKPESMLYLPSSNYVNDLGDVNEKYRDEWYNKYVDDVLTKKGEIAFLLDAANIITSGGSFAGINFDISVAYEQTNQKKILKSKVVSETMVQAIREEVDKPGGILKLAPYPYVDDFNHPNHDKWYNAYDNDGEFVGKGEIGYLLDAANIITGGGNFAGINFDISAAYDQTNQATLLRSNIISESMVHIINDELTDVNSILVKPSVTYVNDIIDSNRDLWYNTYIDTTPAKGEIAHFIDAAYKILGPDLALSEIEFSINILFDETNQEVILKSSILSETIVEKIKGNETAISDVPTEDLRGRPFDDAINRDAWFNIYNEDGSLFEENEIVKFLDSIEIILDGKSFETLGVIDVDYILELDFGIVINPEKVVTSSRVSAMLDSMILEKIISNHVTTIAGTVLLDYLTVPTDGYHWLKADVVLSSILGTYDEALYDLESFLNSLFLMNKLNIKYDKFNEINLLTLTPANNTGLSEAVVVSRVFKGSIAKMFNKLLEPVQNNYNNTLLFPENVKLDAPYTNAYKKAWANVEFNQTVYTGSNLDAYDKLTVKLETFNISYPGSFTINNPPFPPVEQDYEAVLAFYDIE